MGDFGNSGFNPSEVEPSKPLVIPAGVYVCTVIEAQRKPTASGNGDKLSLKFVVNDGPEQGRWIWDAINLWHSSAKTRGFAMQTLHSLCESAGNMSVIRDSSQLVGYRVKLRIKHTPRDDGGFFSNVSEYISAGEAAGQPVATDATDKEPWA